LHAGKLAGDLGEGKSGFPEMSGRDVRSRLLNRARFANHYRGVPMSTKKQGNRISQGVSRMRKLVADLPFIGAGPKGGKDPKRLQEAANAADKASNSGKFSR
jgi:hypothetical protein